MDELDQAAASGEQRARHARAQAEQLRLKAQRLEAFAADVDKGNAGERLTAAQLDVLEGAGWHTLNDRIKDPASRANLDHLVIGPPGVFVVDSKNWGSSIRLTESGLYAGGYSKERELEQVRGAAARVKLHAGQVVAGAQVRPVLCFTAPVGLAAPVDAQGVVALELSSLLPWLTAQPALLTPQQVGQLSASLDVAFAPRLRTAAPALTAPQSSARAVRSRGGQRSRVTPRRATSSPRVPLADKAKLVVALALVVMVMTGTYGGVVTWLSKAITGGLVHAVAPRPTPSPAVPTAPQR